MKTLAKLPVTIVTGFLGSGKTTLLRHMLDNADGRRIAVIVNEFGELGIDGDLLKQCSIGCTEEEANGRVYELANGCLCCTVQEEFFPVMRELVARRGDLDHILIETSGLALPKPLVQAFQWPEIRNACTVDAVITVVDSPAVLAGTFAAFPDQVDAQRKMDPNLDHESPLHELFADQLSSADLVILNKADKMDAAGLAAVRAEVSEELPPAVKVIEASNGRLPISVLLGLGAESELHIDGRHSHHDSHEGADPADHDHDAFDSISITLPQADESLLFDALNQLVVQHGILRVKGFAAIPGKPMRLLIQGVGTRFDKHFDRAWRADEERVTHLVLIGQKLDAGVLEAQLHAAVAG
ncbi:cobalamin biosynthesis protein CobW [Pseudomonas sp. 10B1]|uniref:cobalamin biosynthesis protein CobW n=1 Tax=unclassified Pseudomonas TaxID=196821 RepID=UPI002AB5AF1E|nr:MULTISPECIES: cobalamin biosynthesis protein CobW [unclassified Pseudomonas]MDY7560296.1 cobalamin biosynthesis protein CobW [Pseudomonas sp. AB6]MEA9975588.1 cobalamin biosynthesis protein CobW [Pseudomonas sp. RTS4]MEA9993926.1 cobalamin biosynthesis protein CobW [Pseudomonas sp. AA4]MEB0085394.1 cobalamin biosynthesis protein CobW [Pseudomonas sp. RTI1]MEB0124456.1 cobalamin biosynthesis protein CobW [Pseudomonas sp. CCC1.2]